jgi:hypothetical protein
MYYYELHEGSDGLYADVLLAHEDPIDPEEFFDLVQSIRRQVQERFEEDTLVEAIAEELQRDYGFVFISDDRILAAVNVSMEEDENYLLEADDEAEVADDGEYRTVFAEYVGDDEPGRPN